ncbi:MAG: ECF transporter S component [bacterium]|nr:ECF transporter S component [bacterium]
MNELNTDHSGDKKNIIIKRIIIAVVLTAITLALGLTEIGLIRVPTSANNATILHIPAILGGILTGWIGGLVVGLSFGISSFITSEIPLFQDMWVSIFPRLFIGITAYFTYKGVKKVNEYLAIILAATVGTATNTIIVLTMAVIRGFMKASVALRLGIVHGLPEIVVAIIFVVVIMLAYNFISIAIRRRKNTL